MMESTFAIVGQVLISVVSFGIAAFAGYTKYQQVKHANTITFKKGDKQITISANPSRSEREQLIHF